jgi:hypothetical protein
MLKIFLLNCECKKPDKPGSSVKSTGVRHANPEKTYIRYVAVTEE